MNIKAYVYVCAVTVVLLGAAATIQACYQRPVADMHSPGFVAPNPVCVGCEVQFSGALCYDPDYYLYYIPACEYTTIRGIRRFEWDWNSDGVYDYAENPGDGVATHSWDTPGTKWVTLRVWDNDNPCCCSSGGCEDQWALDVVAVSVVRVDKVVDYYNEYNEGPIYTCSKCASVRLRAKPVGGYYFPALEPHWEIVSQPEGANAILSYQYGSDWIEVDGLTEIGDYVVRARCGPHDTGDTIVITTTPKGGNYWEDIYVDFSCYYYFGCWGAVVKSDDAGNRVKVSCDSAGLLSCAYHMWFSPCGSSDWTKVGICVWNNGINAFRVKVSSESPKCFYETWHSTENDVAGTDGEGCPGYYCARIQKYDCVNRQNEGIWWRRYTGLAGGARDPSGGETCPGGPPGEHPGYPW